MHFLLVRAIFKRVDEPKFTLLQRIGHYEVVKENDGKIKLEKIEINDILHISSTTIILQNSFNYLSAEYASSHYRSQNLLRSIKKFYFRE